MNSAPALRLRLSSENLLLLLAAAVGLGTGLLVVGFRYLIGWWRYLLQDTLVDGLGRAAEHYGLWLLGSWPLALAPVLGGPADRRFGGSCALSQLEPLQLGESCSSFGTSALVDPAQALGGCHLVGRGSFPWP